MPISFLLGTPTSGAFSSYDAYAGVNPEYFVADEFSLFGSFLVSQSLNSTFNPFFNDSLVGVKWSPIAPESFWKPSLTFSVLFPFNTSERTDDFYGGGISPGFTLSHFGTGPNQGFVMSLSVAFVALEHSSSTAADGETNVLSYWQADTLAEYPVTEHWSVGGDFNYSLRRFYAPGLHGEVGFDFYVARSISRPTRLFLGIGNLPIQRQPENLAVPLESYDSTLTIWYLGLSYTL